MKTNGGLVVDIWEASGRTALSVAMTMIMVGRSRATPPLDTDPHHMNAWDMDGGLRPTAHDNGKFPVHELSTLMALH